MDLTAHEIEFRERLAHLETLKAAGHRPSGGRSSARGRWRTSVPGLPRPPRAGGGARVAVREMGKSTFAHLQDGTDKFQIYGRNRAGRRLVFGVQGGGSRGFHRGGGSCSRRARGSRRSRCSSGSCWPRRCIRCRRSGTGCRTRRCATASGTWTDCESGRAPGVRRAQPPAVASGGAGGAGLLRGGDAGVAGAGGRGDRRAVPDALQRAGAGDVSRIAPELYLKRLLVGGYDKVFERHSQRGPRPVAQSEFTALEIYEAYGDMRTMMKLEEELVSGAAQAVCGTMQWQGGAEPVDRRRRGAWRPITTWCAKKRERTGSSGRWKRRANGRGRRSWTFRTG